MNIDKKSTSTTSSDMHTPKPVQEWYGNNSTRKSSTEPQGNLVPNAHAVQVRLVAEDDIATQGPTNQVQPARLLIPGK